MTPTCEDHQIAYLQGEEAARGHVGSCATCRSTVAELDDIRIALADAKFWVEPDEDLEDRVVAAVYPGDTQAVRFTLVSDGTREPRATKVGVVAFAGDTPLWGSDETGA